MQLDFKLVWSNELVLCWLYCQQTGTQCRGSGGQRRVFGQAWGIVHWDPIAHTLSWAMDAYFSLETKIPKFVAASNSSHYELMVYWRMAEEWPAQGEVWRLVLLSLLGLAQGWRWRYRQLHEVNSDEPSHSETWHAEGSQRLINSAWPEWLPSTPITSHCLYLIKNSCIISCVSLFHQDIEEWHPMGHVTSHNSFLWGDGSFCLWRWLITADSFVSHTVMSCHLCIWLAERFCPPLLLAVHQCYTKTSKVKFG